MQVKVHNVVIDRDKMFKPSKQVWDWELPLLQAKFDGRVQVNGSTYIEAELPEVADEFSRLGDQFGNREGSTDLLVEREYGYGDKGIAALGKAIQDAVQGSKRKKPKAVKAKAIKAKADIIDEDGEDAEFNDPLG